MISTAGYKNAASTSPRNGIRIIRHYSKCTTPKKSLCKEARCTQNTAKEHTSSPASRSSANSPPACPALIVCLQISWVGGKRRVAMKRRLLLHSLSHTFVIVDITKIGLSMEIYPRVGSEQTVPFARFQSRKEAEQYLRALGAGSEEIERTFTWLTKTRSEE